MPGGHWSAALHDPDATVAALLGDDGDRAAHAPYVFSQQLGHDLALFGVPAEGDEVVLRGDPAGGATGHEGWAAFYVPPPTLSGPGDPPRATTPQRGAPTSGPCSSSTRRATSARCARR